MNISIVGIKRAVASIEQGKTTITLYDNADTVALEIMLNTELEIKRSLPCFISSHVPTLTQQEVNALLSAIAEGADD